jgi:riboflavin synthase
MFTGIIAAVGHIESIEPKEGDLRLNVATEQLDLTDVKLGDSIAINGVCLTVIAQSSAQVSFDVSSESLQLTSLSAATVGSLVNLEKALAVGDRLGGHIVSGHVDGLGKVVMLEESARSVKFRLEVPVDLSRYIAKKGSISIDGVSLTVNLAEDNWFEVNIIPHTMQETIIKQYAIGSMVNLEVDLIARYLERLLPHTDATDLIQNNLLKNGFINS